MMQSITFATPHPAFSPVVHISLLSLSTTCFSTAQGIQKTPLLILQLPFLNSLNLPLLQHSLSFTAKNKK